MDKRTESQVALDGQEAERILGSKVYKDAMQMVRDQIVEQWKACPVRDKEGQTILLQLAKLTDKFEGLLSGTIEAGKMAQAKIDIDSLRDESVPRRFMRRVVNG